MDFQVGNVVKLRSGGPGMTIAELSWETNVQNAKCMWFVEGEAKTALFPINVLTKAPETR